MRLMEGVREAPSPESPMQHQRHDSTTFKPDSYGILIVLGYNNEKVLSPQRKDDRSPTTRVHYSRYELRPKMMPNGLVKGAEIEGSSADAMIRSMPDEQHTVTYESVKNRTATIVLYNHDDRYDMYQIGRSSEPQIDFSVVDTILANGVQPSIDGKCKKMNKTSFSSTISRFACRLLVDRKTKGVHVYAAGFDNKKNIFLGEKASKWRKKTGEWDGLTTNGILVLHPHSTDGDHGEEEVIMYAWREVSVDGDIYSLRSTRASPTRGDLLPTEDNLLKDGTLVDLCGATLLYRSPSGVQCAPTHADLDVLLDQLNSSKPQCPVNLMTLVVPKRRARHASMIACKSDGTPIGHTNRQPYAYLECGHVQGAHMWGHATSQHHCPMCMRESPRMLSLSLGMEPLLHMDCSPPDHAFNPCGHMGSLTTVRYWSRIELPHGTNHFYPVCPFCCVLLDRHKPFVRLIFQSDD